MRGIIEVGREDVLVTVINAGRVGELPGRKPYPLSPGGWGIEMTRRYSDDFLLTLDQREGDRHCPQGPGGREVIRMGRTIKAGYSHGIIESLEPLELEEGKELVVTIKEPPSEEDRFEQAAGSWTGLIDAEEFLRDIYTTRSLPRNID